MESMTKMLRAAVILGLLAGLPALALSESPQSLLKRFGWLRRQTAQMLASLQAAVDAKDVEPQPTPLPPETPPEQSAPLSAPLPAEDSAVSEPPEPGLPVLPPAMSAHYPGRLAETEGEPVAASV
ncbi:MAG: hypothetical protein KDA41_20100, partial [Planctomycetales bacterium]|nr:hypothetical protein [Planctomycetales bacterium]